MKSLIKFAGLFLMFSCTLLITMDIQNVSDRDGEIEEAVSISMRNTLKASNFMPMYEMSEQDMRVEFIRNFAENINGDGTFRIAILESSDRGLLDVNVEETFLHNNGQSGKRSLRRTLLLEEYPR